MEKLDETFEKIHAENPYCIIGTGDYNAHHKDWYHKDTTNEAGITLKEILDKHSLHQLVTEPTYIVSNACTCVDLVYTDQPNLITQNSINPSLHKNCHHQVNHFQLNLICSPPPPYQRFIWHFGRAKKVELLRAMRMYDWERALLLRQTNIDDQVSQFEEVVNNISKEFIPHENRTFYPRDPPWLTKNCKDFYKKYHRKYKSYARRGFIAEEKTQIDDLRAQYTVMVETAKETYLKRLGSEVSNPQTGQKKVLDSVKKTLKQEYLYSDSSHTLRERICD
jgi:hypothetical protein